MFSVISVVLLSVSAYGACLRSVFRIYLDDCASVHLSLVRQFLFQIIVRPADLYVSVLYSYTLSGGTYPRQIFQNE